MEEVRTITVHIKVFRQAFPDRDAIQITEGARVRDLMTTIEDRYFADDEGAHASLLKRGMPREDLLFILNGRLISNLSGLDIILKDGDEFAIFPVMAGG